MSSKTLVDKIKKEINPLISSTTLFDNIKKKQFHKSQEKTN